jgi:hypothetical protein
MDKDFWKMTASLAGFIGALFLIFLLIVWLAKDSPAQLQYKYSAWCKAAGVTNLSFEEWNTLYQGEMLPGQTKHETVIVPVYISN